MDGDDKPRTIADDQAEIRQWYDEWLDWPYFYRDGSAAAFSDFICARMCVTVGEET